ncbi:MAG: hypothetical protein ACI8W8_001280 [Rhodothermales bacterium]
MDGQVAACFAIRKGPWLGVGALLKSPSVIVLIDEGKLTKLSPKEQFAFQVVLRSPKTPQERAMSEYTEYSETIYTVSELFSPERCDELMSLSENMGYTDAPITTMHGPVMRPDIRNNQRVILDDYELADEIWDLVRPYSRNSFGGCDAVGVNERFRFYRYDVGQLFDFARDGALTRTHREQSRFTLIFLLERRLRRRQH